MPFVHQSVWSSRNNHLDPERARIREEVKERGCARRDRGDDMRCVPSYVATWRRQRRTGARPHAHSIPPLKVRADLPGLHPCSRRRRATLGTEHRRRTSGADACSFHRCGQ